MLRKFILSPIINIEKRVNNTKTFFFKNKNKKMFKNNLCCFVTKSININYIINIKGHMDKGELINKLCFVLQYKFYETSTIKE